MEQHAIGPCPYCEAQLESGHLGFASGILWSRQRLNWWQSIFFIAILYGQFVVGGLGSTPWFRSRSAHRCTDCGALVVPADQ